MFTKLFLEAFKKYIPSRQHTYASSTNFQWFFFNKIFFAFKLNIVLLLVLYENLKELELSALQVPSSVVEYCVDVE